MLRINRRLNAGIVLSGITPATDRSHVFLVLCMCNVNLQSNDKIQLKLKPSLTMMSRPQIYRI